MTKGAKVGLGCAAIPIIAVITAIVFLGRSAPAPSTTPSTPHAVAIPPEPDTSESRARLHDEVYPLVRQAEAAGDHEKALAILRGGAFTTRPDWFTVTDEYKRLSVKLTKEVAVVEAKRAREEVTRTAQARIAGRKVYAHTLREHFLDSHLDIEVRAVGKNADRLMLKWVLFNAVWAHEFGKGSLIKEIEAMGFKRVDLDSGYDYGSYFTLSPPPGS